MEIFPFLFGSICFVCTIQFLLHKNGKNGNNFYTAVDKYIKEEQEANFITKNFDDIDLIYIYPNLHELPFIDYDLTLSTPENKFNILVKRQDFVKRKADLKMIKLPINLCNRELKTMVGINNFEKISIWETHYNSYIRALYEWGLELYKLEKYEDCKLVLLEGVRLEGDISDIYILLSNIYNINNDKSSLLILKNKIEDYDLSLKTKICTHIDNILVNGILEIN